MHIVIAGGSGFIGRKLCRKLIKDNCEVSVLSRRAGYADEGVKTVLWDAAQKGPWTQILEGADAVINLTGAGIADKLWTAKRKEELRSSRVETTRLIAEAIAACVTKPKKLLNASAVGYYGHRQEELDEESPAGQGYLADLCRQWEYETQRLNDICPVVLLRIGLVLGPGGMLSKMKGPFKLGLGAVPGNGEQWFPWIHVDDLVDAIIFLLKNDVKGAFNLTAPEPVTMQEFCSLLARCVRRWRGPKIPAAMIELLIGDMAQLFTEGQRPFPKKLKDLGFKHRYTNAQSAIKQVIGDAV